MARSDTDTKTNPSHNHDHDPGTFARLTTESEVVCIVDTPEEQAGDYQIDKLDGRTVADANADNSRVSPEDDVVEVVFPSSVNHYAKSLTSLEGWTPSSLAGMRAGGRLSDTPVTVYAYPASLVAPSPATTSSDESPNRVNA